MTLADFKRLKGQKRGKYNNQKTIYNGRQYDSKKEAKRAWELDLLLRSGNILSWKSQPEFPIVLNGIKICSYFGDFLVEYQDRKEVEDVKGFRTDIYKIKRKLVKAFYGIDIKEL